MPTYEYRCEKCEGTFDAFQSMKDAAYAVCPKALCRQDPWGEGKVKRLLGTGAGLIFKGSGFYTTDYRSSGYKEAAKKESAANGGGGGSGGEGGGSTKPAETKPASSPSKEGSGTKSSGTKATGGDAA